MNSFLDFIEKYKFGILATFATYIAIFMYLNIKSYKKFYEIPAWTETTKLEIPEEISLKTENIDQKSIENQLSNDVKSISRNQDDAREKSFENWSQNKSQSLKSVEQQVYDLEKQYYAESGGSVQREKIKQQMEELKKQQKSNEKTAVDVESDRNTSGGNKSYAGNVMVDWTLKSREAHQNNNWYVRNPGYTCGHGSSGKVTIKIRVDQAGNVVSSVYVPEMSFNANSCMIEQATKYAGMSRFNYSASAPKTQDGIITYTFVSQ
jgi:hypothetical protein